MHTGTNEKGIGLIGCKIVYGNTSVLHSAGFDIAVSVRSLYQNRSQGEEVIWPHRRFEGVEKNDSRLHKTQEVQGVSSQCFIVDKSTYLEVNGMDPTTESNTNLYHTPFVQTMDLSWRLMYEKGLRNIYLPTASSVFLFHASSGTFSLLFSLL